MLAIVQRGSPPLEAELMLEEEEEEREEEEEEEEEEVEEEGAREGTAKGWRGGPRLRAGGGEEEALRGGGPRLAPKAVLESQAERAAAAGPKRPPRFAGDAVAEVAAEEAAPGRVFLLGGE